MPKGLACSVACVGLAAAMFAARVSAQTDCGPDPSQWQMVFEENFDATTLDPAKWRIEDAALVKNNELQYYAPDEVYTENGHLVLRSRQRSYGGRNYTSGLVDTIGRFALTYGRVEARMKLPRGQGLWPAFWMLPADGAWPPEIDIMELLGNNPNRVYMTHHWGAWPNVSHYGCDFSGPDFSQGYHTFTIEWTPDHINWYVDGVLRCFASSPIPDRPMYIILNTAVGGDWPGNPNAQTVFPQYTEIDYVRAWTRGDLVQPNTLWNRSFDDGNAVANPPIPLPAWTVFGNTYKNTNVSRTGGASMKVFGNFNGQPNSSGGMQSLVARPGEVWSAEVWARHISGDLLAPGNSAIIKLEWLDEVGGVIGSNQSTVLTSTSAANTWIRGTTGATAPPGAVRARLALLVSQVNNGAGAAYFDDSLLTRVSAPPPCAADFDNSGSLSVNDLFVFLNRYFGNCPAADYNGDGGLSVQDIFDFLAGFFTGCD